MSVIMTYIKKCSLSSYFRNGTRYFFSFIVLLKNSLLLMDLARMFSPRSSLRYMLTYWMKQKCFHQRTKTHFCKYICVRFVCMRFVNRCRITSKYLKKYYGSIMWKYKIKIIKKHSIEGLPQRNPGKYSNVDKHY